MAKQLQLRRGTTAQHSTFTGAVGEVTIDTDKDVVVVHDGSTAGGKAMVKEADTAYTIATVNDFGTVPVGYTTVIVKDTDRGGVFNRIASTIANGGTVFAGSSGYWVRQYSGAVNVKWFGAKDTEDAEYETFNSTDAINYCVNNFNNIYIPKGTYKCNVVHTDGFIVVNGASNLETKLQSYTSDGFAFLEQNTQTTWSNSLIISNLSFIGDGVKSGFSFGDGTNNSSFIYCGRSEFNSVGFYSCYYGIKKPSGNIGNAFNKCTFSDCSYGYYAINYSTQMHTGCDIFTSCEFNFSIKAAVYISDNSSGAGQHTFQNCIFEGNIGASLFIKNYIYVSGLVLNNTWYENNASMLSSVIIDSTTYTTKDIICVNTTGIYNNNSNSFSIYLENSNSFEDGCTYSNNKAYTSIIDSNSLQTITNAMTGYSFTTNSSKINTLGALYANANDIGNIWIAPNRTSVSKNYKNATIRYSNSFQNNPYTFYKSIGGNIYTSTSNDGCLFPRSANIVIPSGILAFSSDTISLTANKWYVYTFEIKLISNTNISEIKINDGATYSYQPTYNLASLIEKDKWVTVCSVFSCRDGGSPYNPYIKNNSASNLELRLGCFQVVEFNSKADAIQFYNEKIFIDTVQSKYASTLKASTLISEYPYEPDNYSVALSTVYEGVMRHKFNVNYAGSSYTPIILQQGNVGIGTAPVSYSLQLASDSAGKPSTNTWTISSDERLKENIELADLDRCYDIVKTIPLKRYKWKDNVYSAEHVSDRNKLGWIANDVKNVFPKAVNTHTQQLNSFSIEKEIIEIPSYKEVEIFENGISTNKFTIEKTIEIVEQEKKVYDVLEDCLDLNADQIYAVMFGAIQKLQEKVEALESK